MKKLLYFSMRKIIQSQLILKQMKSRLIFFILVLFISSCVKHEGDLVVYPAKEYIVASDKGCYQGSADNWIPYYFIKEKGAKEWDTQYEKIEGLDYQRGHEYRIRANRILDQSLLGYADDVTFYYLRLVKVLSDEEKQSEGLPEHYIPYSPDLPPPSEYFNR